MQHFGSTLAFKRFILLPPILYVLRMPPHRRLLLLAVSLHLLLHFATLTPSGFFNRMLGGLQARSIELLHFLSSNLVDLIFTQESNLNSSSSFRIPRFSALRSDRTPYGSGIIYLDATHASGGVIIFVRRGLSFSEFSTASLSSLDPYSDYVGVNISLNNSSSLSFLNVYAPPICCSPTNGKTDSFSPSIFFSSTNLFILGEFNFLSPLLGLKRYFRPCEEEVFDWIISSDLLPLNDLDIPTLLH